MSSAKPTFQFPEYSFQIKQQGQKKLIFDPARKKLIPLTPEEWVRQHAIEYLHQHFKLDYSLISVERELKYNGLVKRFDIVASCPGSPFSCLVECKAPDIELKAEILLQAAVYNQKFNCRWLWITNGIRHLWFELRAGKIIPVEEPNQLC